jgi:hypothetical protein
LPLAIGITNDTIHTHATPELRVRAEAVVLAATFLAIMEQDYGTSSPINEYAEGGNSGSVSGAAGGFTSWEHMSGLVCRGLDALEQYHGRTLLQQHQLHRTTTTATNTTATATATATAATTTATSGSSSSTASNDSNSSPKPIGVWPAFVKRMWPSVAEKNPNLPHAEVMKILGGMWAQEKEKRAQKEPKATEAKLYQSKANRATRGSGGGGGSASGGIGASVPLPWMVESLFIVPIPEVRSC